MVWETNILYFLVRIMLFETTWKKRNVIHYSKQFNDV